MNDEIEIKDLDVTFQTDRISVHAVKNVSLSLKPNRITGLIGETGSGKSVMASAILRLLPDYAKIKGEITYQGKNLLQKTLGEMREIRRYQIGLIPQNPTEALNPSRKIYAQIGECFDQKGRSNYSSVLKLLQTMSFASPEQIGSMYPYQLSGGMKQRVVSLFGMREPLHWIIADEPTKGLDTIVYRQVFQSLQQLAQMKNRSMVVITHDLMLAERLCDDLAVMYEGQVIETGNASEILSNPFHPYTRGLIQSHPQNGMHPIPVKTAVTNGGCSFWSRCSMRQERCRKINPCLCSISDNRKVRCLQYDMCNTGE